jgi:hypothetical protein
MTGLKMMNSFMNLLEFICLFDWIGPAQGLKATEIIVC